MKEGTEPRNENKAETKATIKDAQDSQAAVSEAVEVLTEFYKSSGMVPKESFEFLQTMSHRDVVLPDAPTTWDSSYTGVSDPNDPGQGILAILDEARQKFSQMEADARAQDASDQKTYEEDKAAKQVQINEVTLDTRAKGEKQDNLKESTAAAAQKLKVTADELNSVKQYMKDLEPACGEGDSSFEDRRVPAWKRSTR